MEESPIIDSPAEAKPHPLTLALSVLATVLGILAIIIAVRTNGNVSKLQDADNSTAINEAVKKAVEGELQRLREPILNIQANRKDISTLANQVSQLNSGFNSLRSVPGGNAGPQLAALTQQAAAIEARLKTLESRRVGGSGTDVRPPPPPPARDNVRGDPPPAIGGGVVAPGSDYTVRRGDTLTSIAHKHNVTVRELEVANPRLAAQPTRLVLGAKVKIPAKSGTTAQPAGGRSGNAGSGVRR